MLRLFTGLTGSINYISRSLNSLNIKAEPNSGYKRTARERSSIHVQLDHDSWPTQYLEQVTV